jgi:hypothetical protein
VARVRALDLLELSREAGLWRATNLFSQFTWVAEQVAYLPCSATERLRAPADSVTAGMDIQKTCFELGCEEEDDSSDSGVVGNSRRWRCAPQSAANLLTKSWRGGAVVWCAGAGAGGKRT